MFWILMELGQLIGKGISGVGAASDNKASKEHFKQARASGEWDRDTWIDRKGVERDMVTNELRFTCRENGDKIVKDVHGNVIRNISKEKRQAEYANALRNRGPKDTVVEWKEKVYGKNGEFIKGSTWKDVKTGQIYAVRRIADPNPMSCARYDFFLDVSTGEYVRPTDHQYQVWEMYSDGSNGSLEEARTALKKHLETGADFQYIDPYDNAFAECGSALRRNIEPPKPIQSISF